MKKKIKKNNFRILKKGQKVTLITGKEKGYTNKIILVKDDYIKIQGCNLKTRYKEVTETNEQNEKIKKKISYLAEGFIHESNVKLVD